METTERYFQMEMQAKILKIGPASQMVSPKAQLIDLKTKMLAGS